MNAPATRSIVQLFPLILLLLLTGCGSSDGADPDNSQKSNRTTTEQTYTTSGTISIAGPGAQDYSFAGAQISLRALDKSLYVNQAAKKTAIKMTAFVTPGNAAYLTLDQSALQDDKLYVVELNCCADETTEPCPFRSTLHVTLSGKQLRAGGWTISVLTELAYQKLAYYVLADYSHTDVATTLDNIGRWLLLPTSGNSAPDYTDVLAWSPTTDPGLNHVRNPYLIQTTLNALAEGTTTSHLQQQAAQMADPVVAEITDFEQTYDIVTHGNVAFVAAHNDGIFSLSLRDPEHPVVLDNLPLSGSTRRLAFYCNYLYVTNGNSISIIDVTNPRNLQLVGTMPDIGGERNKLAIAIENNYAYVLDYDSDVELHHYIKIFDISDPVYPRLLTKFDATSEAPYGYVETNAISVHGGYVYISGSRDNRIDDTGYVHVFDAINPYSPEMVGSFNSHTEASIVVSGNYAYALKDESMRDGGGGLQVVAISNPTSPAPLGFVTMPDGATNLELLDSHAYAVGSFGLQIVDISNPRNLDIDQRTYTEQRYDIAVKPPYAYLTGENSVQVVDLRLVEQPVLSGTLPTPGIAHSMAQKDNHLLVANGLDGLRSVDISDPTAPRLAPRSYPSFRGTITRSVTVANDRAYAASLFGGYSWIFDGNVSVFDVSTPETPTPLPASMSGAAFAVSANDNYLYAQYALEYLGVYDISDPLSPPILVAEVDGFSSYSHQFLATNGFGYWPGGLGVLDLSAGSPTLVGYASASSGDFVSVNDQYAFLTGKNSQFRGFELVDIQDPYNPSVLSTLTTPYETRSSTLSGHYAYVAAGRKGLQVVDFSDPDNLQLLATADTIGEANSVLVHDGYVFVGTTYGVEVLKTLP